MITPYVDNHWRANEITKANGGRVDIDSAAIYISNGMMKPEPFILAGPSQAQVALRRRGFARIHRAQRQVPPSSVVRLRKVAFFVWVS